MKIAVLLFTGAVLVSGAAHAVDLDAAQAVCARHRFLHHSHPQPGQAPDPDYVSGFQEMCTKVDQEIQARAQSSHDAQVNSDLDTLKSVAPTP